MFLKSTTSFLCVMVFWGLNTTAQAATACQAPAAPSIPDSKTATKTEIMAALQSIKNDFQPAIKTFQNCVAAEQAATADVATEEQIAEWDQLFDSAYLLETKVAEDMNAVIRAFKARAAKQ